MKVKYRPLSADHAMQKYQEKKIIKEIESIIKKLDDNNKKIERELKEMDNYSNNYSHKIDLIKKLVQKKNIRKKMS